MRPGRPSRRWPGSVDGDRATEVWEAALAARWEGRPVWFHGDVAAGNLLLRDDRLAAVLDFGCCGVGDPACDLTAAWTVFSGEAHSVFRRGLSPDDATWTRARGWALCKALITAREPGRGEALRVVREVLADG